VAFGIKQDELYGAPVNWAVFRRLLLVGRLSKRLDVRPSSHTVCCVASRPPCYWVVRRHYGHAGPSSLQRTVAAPRSVADCPFGLRCTDAHDNDRPRRSPTDRVETRLKSRQVRRLKTAGHRGSPGKVDKSRVPQREPLDARHDGRRSIVDKTWPHWLLLTLVALYRKVDNQCDKLKLIDRLHATR